MKKKLVKVKIQKLPFFLPFEALHKDYGRAEFQICPVYKYGKLRQCYIYHRQQENIHFYYLWEGKAEGYSFTGYEDLDAPRIWRNGWCKEHKCNTVELYVPPDSKFLYIDCSLQTFGINFTKTDWTKPTKPI